MGSSFTVYFDGTFWVGVVEICEPGGQVRAARHVFGVEPTAAELLDFVRHDAGRLLDRALASPAVPPGREADPGPPSLVNRKRAARQASREQVRSGPSTAAQAALARALEESGRARRAEARADDAGREERRRQAKVDKRKARHRGR